MRKVIIISYTIDIEQKLFDFLEAFEESLSVEKLAHFRATYLFVAHTCAERVDRVISSLNFENFVNDLMQRYSINPFVDDERIPDEYYDGEE